MFQLYHLILYKPLLNLLVCLYNLIHDAGLAIILVTLVVRLILIPLTLKSTQGQLALQKLQPKLDELRKKYKNDRTRQSQEMMKFYQQHKINPLSSCLPLLIQLPILIALYGVFQEGLTTVKPENIYPFISNPGQINPIFLGWLDLTQKNLVLAILAGLTQFIQTKMLMPRKKKEAKTGMGDLGKLMGGQTMTYVMPFMTVFIALSLPSGLALYWVAATIFAIIQQWIIMKKGV